MKRRTQDLIKICYANWVGERMFLPIVRGCQAESLIAKCLPDNHLYKEFSLRTVTRHQLKFEFDLSDFVDRHIYFQLADDSLEFYFSKIKKNDVILDVGANNGYTMLRAGVVAFQGRVIGFEPSESNFFRCKRNIDLNNLSNCEAVQLALGAKEGNSYLDVPNPGNRGMNRVSASGNGCEEIKIVRLDKWLHGAGIEKVDIIKIDVEGFEMEVLKGAEKTIVASRPSIFIEVNDQYLKNFGSGSIRLGQWLIDREYELFTTKGTKIVDLMSLTFHQNIWATPRL